MASISRDIYNLFIIYWIRIQFADGDNEKGRAHSLDANVDLYPCLERLSSR